MLTGLRDTNLIILQSLMYHELQQLCQCNHEFTQLCQLPEMKHRILDAQEKARNFMIHLENRSDIGFQPMDKDEKFEAFHDIMKRLSIPEEDYEEDEHPSDIQNNLTVGFISIYNVKGNDNLNIVYRNYNKSISIEHAFLGRDVDMTVFYPSKRQCEMFIFELFYNRMILSF